MAEATTLAYPNFEDQFDIHTDASKVQLGGIISQKERPIAFYSRKLNPAQTKYSITELELLSIVEILKEYRTILLGNKIVIYTDHKNLECKNFKVDRVIRWRLILEEYAPTIQYIKGKANQAADALSRLPMTPVEEDTLLNEQCFLLEHWDYPLAFDCLQEHQRKDKQVQKTVKDNPEAFKIVKHNKWEVIYTKTNRIVVPSELIQPVLEFYHDCLLHPGIHRMSETLKATLYWPKMEASVIAFVRGCGKCQIKKNKQKPMANYHQKSWNKNPGAL